DMPAAHEVAGFSPHNSTHFCRFCFLPSSDIDNLDMGSWPQRSFDEHRSQALKWKEAATEAERAAITTSAGLRYSVLLRLAYWNAILFTVIDSMHAILLGLIETHCRSLWGMNNKAADFDGISPMGKSVIDSTVPALKSPCQRKTNARLHPPTKAISTTKDVRVDAPVDSGNVGGSNDKDLKSDSPLEGDSRGENEASEPSLTSEARETLSCMSDLENRKTISTPSWLGRAPKRAGSAQQGKLKADEWRSFCCISLVFTLIRIWGHDEGRYGEMLANFMHLVDMVNLAHYRELDEKTIESYRCATLDYLEGVKALFYDHTLVPNHHAVMHLPDLFRRFGPVHAWRTFAFERYNGMMQSINHNSRIGAY
ncbi:hypothetical protein SISSUDRAFT_957467, partial [Sistotremastrum suecicum HHB10207 ss-3]